MPIKHGGLGIRWVTSLAAPLAHISCPTDLFIESYISSRSTSAGPPPDLPPGKQSFGDSPGLHADRAVTENYLVEPSQKARFLASLAPHSGDWLFALTVVYGLMTKHCMLLSVCNLA